tara:strand:+ start:96 stop:218 length:123 start_codon:yes stop_codon:yes gene_type:complete
LFNIFFSSMIIAFAMDVLVMAQIQFIKGSFIVEVQGLFED